MTTEVLTFRPDINVADAMAELVARGVDGAPVLDDDGEVVGVISTGDLIVQETELHVPTVISLFGATLELPSSKRHFEEDLRRALGSTVADVMSTDPVTIDPAASVEQAATKMHHEEVSRLPVVDGGRLVGIVSRTDIVRAIIADDATSTEG
ncbi:MAG: CBS domain-containing protein [Acidimicrobiales bacterium]